MSELADKRHQREGYLNPSELSPVELLDAFFSQLRHPGLSDRPSAEIGEFVASHLGVTDGNELTHDQLAWSHRMQEIMVDMYAIDNEEHVLDDWLEHDQPLAAIFDALRATRKEFEEKKSERVALFALCDLRAGVLHRREAGESNDEGWLALVRKLSY